MRLFYLPMASSLAVHIVLRELGLPFHLERVDRATRRTTSGEDFTALNPKGYVPALQLDGGEVLTEGPAIMQFLHDTHAPGDQGGDVAGVPATSPRAGRGRHG